MILSYSQGLAYDTGMRNSVDKLGKGQILGENNFSDDA